ncbi:hypothetical protein LOTGIDRAFT_160411 [Lottia gigantea]|uniref:Cyclic nucleotide-binding domain-containing protein n=1 Tax=Lottia gigantea TaxID=225164 RepID=V4ANS2_LOTGI|nr:hypothetical protein LOTGIDRAFT_160411 [Lottia gigantea]ESO95291.1 hypothetical protein LOTGIDRAFT_160411 [Lottia gigantea]
MAPEWQLNMTEDNHRDDGGVHYEHDKGPVAAVVLFIFCSCALGALVRQVVESIPVKLPYTVLLLLLGVLFGLISKNVPSVHEYANIVETDPHIILHTFLPVLIFESAFAMEVHTFKRTFFQVLLLAVPGLALSSFLVCIMSRYLFTYEWSWTIGMMFGSILSATDPVAVVAILREVGASKQLSMVIEGESLLNDGAAIVFFNIFLTLCTSEVGLTGSDMVLTFLRVAVGGPAFGLVMAKITLFWLSRIFNDCLSEITITLASTYLTYYIGEQFLGVSGVLAVVVLGVVMSGKKTSISPEVEAFLHRFWETLAYLANTLIFILVGVVISEKAIFRIHGIDWFYMFALYFGLQVIRGLVIALFSPILRRIGYGMTWQEGIIMTWGGLRGAVGLALGLLVWEQELLDLENVRLKVLIHVSGIVFLTLLINATTVPHVLKILGMNDVSPAKRMAMASALRYLEELRQKTFNMLKTDRFLADADWDMVEKSCQIIDPYRITDEDIVLEDSMDIRPNAICPDCDACLPSQPTRKELREMTNEAILRFLKAEKLSYWRQFVQGMLSREAVRKLQECTEVAADKKGKFIEVDEIKKLWEVPEYLLKIKRYLKSVIRFVPVKVYNYKYLKALYHITNTKAFHIFIYCIIVLDTISSSLSIVALYDIDWLNYRHIMGAFNVVFVIIYLMEVIIKLICQRRFFFTVVWQILGLLVVLHGIVDAVLQFTLEPYNIDNSPNTVYRNVLVVMISIRSIRLLRLIEPLLPTILLLVKTRISLHLSNGYDLGRGFVSGEEEVRKLIDHMVDNRDIAKQLKHHCDASKLDVIRCLGLLQKNHPDIALSVKTRQAIRSVLNNLRDGINELHEDGVLVETEREKLRKMVEVQMKKLLTAPPSMPLPPPEKLLNNVTWLQNDEKLIDYFKNCAQLVSYDYGDVILNEGDPSQGIYIIVSGLVRLETTRSRTRSSTSATTLFENKLMDFLTTGNIIGEMGFLTHRSRMASVKCETAVQLLHISSEDMEKAFEEFVETEPSLEYRLWRVCASRLAVSVLMEQPDYQGWTKEKIKLRLENSYLVSGDENDTFTIDSGMADILLIHGYAHNAFTREPFVGPCYIPLTVLKLNLHTDKIAKPVILIIPSEMGPGIPSERRQSFHDVSSEHNHYLAAKLCLRHASVHRRESAVRGLNPSNNKKALSQRHSVAQFSGARKPSQVDIFGRRQSITSNASNKNQSVPLGKRMSTPACIETHNRERLISTGSDNAFNSPEHGRTSFSDIPGNRLLPTDIVPSRLASRRGSDVSHILPTIPQEDFEADSSSFKHTPDLTKADHELDKNTSNLTENESPQHLKPYHGRGLLKFDSNSQSSQLLFQRLRTLDMDPANSDSDSMREYDHPNNNSSSVEDNEMADTNSNYITKNNLTRAKGNYDPSEDYYNSWRVGGRKLSRFFSDTDRDDVISCSSTDSTVDSEPDDTEDEMHDEVHINLAAEDDDGKPHTQSRTSCSSILDDASMVKYANALMNNLNSADSHSSHRTRKTAMEAEAGSFILQNIEPDTKNDEAPSANDQAIEDSNEVVVGVENDLPPDLPTLTSEASRDVGDDQIHFVNETKDDNTEEEKSDSRDDAEDKDKEEIQGTVGPK